MSDIRKIQEQLIFAAVKAASNDSTAREIVYGEPNEADAAWAKSVMNRLENHFDQAAVKLIRMNCQCGYDMDEKLKLVQALVKSASDLEEFAKDCGVGVKLTQ